MKTTAIISFVFLSIFLHAQSPDHNWIKEKIYRVPTTQPIASPSVNQAFVTVKYYDGLGRPEQEIQQSMSASGHNIVLHHEYDAYGRETKKFLPYPDPTPGLDFVPNAGIQTQNYYQNRFGTSVCYTETLLENSPLNRPLLQAAPGDTWALGNGHEIKYRYDTNTANEVRMFDVSQTYNAATDRYIPTLIDRGYYPPQSLYKFVTADENNNLGGTGNSIEFKDKDGRIVLKRQTTAQGNVDTYYVYDRYGNLTYVIPPLAAEGNITQSVLDNLCYQYVYDSRNRLVAKKLPGIRWQYMAYDKLDRLRATGPVKSPFTNTSNEGWLITKYDGLNRPIMTVFKPATVNARTRMEIQRTINNHEISEAPVSDPMQEKNIDFYYTSESFPDKDYYILTITYYDDYRFWPQNQIPAQILNQPVRTGANGNLKGLTTGQWVRILKSAYSTDHYTELTFYKDDPTAAVIGTEKHRGNLYHKQHHATDFEGKILQTKTCHRMTPELNEIVTVEDLEYTPQGRLLRHRHRVENHVETILAEFSYDELGKIRQKNIDNNLQSVSFQYNIRGWLTRQQSQMFELELLYDNGQTPLYNGNISAQRWWSASDNQTRRYDYQYDKLNRLTSAEFTNENRNLQGSYDVALSYDKQGNIQDVERWGLFELQNQTIDIDNLQYKYDPANPNRLLGVRDHTANEFGFKDDPNHSLNDYTYDTDGNMITDNNKGITEIRYNHMNLPTQVRFNNGEISFTYDALGNKWYKYVETPTGKKGTAYLFGYQYEFDYIGEVQYDWKLMFIPTAEGYVSAVYPEGITSGDPPKFAYVTNIRDHLGNLRMSLTRDNGQAVILQERHYYPFGLLHRGYNEEKHEIQYTEAEEDKIFTPQVVAGRYKYWYQEQERQTDLDLNWDSFKYRNYNYAIGRFMSVDLWRRSIRITACIITVRTG